MSECLCHDNYHSVHLLHRRIAVIPASSFLWIDLTACCILRCSNDCKSSLLLLLKWLYFVYMAIRLIYSNPCISWYALVGPNAVIAINNDKSIAYTLIIYFCYQYYLSISECQLSILISVCSGDRSPLVHPITIGAARRSALRDF